jgi:hypothetical protein
MLPRCLVLLICGALFTGCMGMGPYQRSYLIGHDHIEESSVALDCTPDLVQP